jgi:hypothetical protein
MKGTSIASAADMLTHDTFPQVSRLVPWAFRWLKRGAEIGGTFDPGKSFPVVDCLSTSVDDSEHRRMHIARTEYLQGLSNSLFSDPDFFALVPTSVVLQHKK